MLSLIHANVQRITDNAPLITYTGSTSAVLFWGLNLSDIGVIVSSLASVCGVVLQFYVAMQRVRAIKQREEIKAHGSGETE